MVSNKLSLFVTENMQSTNFLFDNDLFFLLYPAFEVGDINKHATLKYILKYLYIVQTTIRKSKENKAETYVGVQQKLKLQDNKKQI